MSERVRMSDIARLAAVSTVTVSKVLSHTKGNNTSVAAETAQRILDIAKQAGYKPNNAARQLKGQQSRLIGVLIDTYSSPAEFMRVSYAEQAADLEDYRLIIGQCKPDMDNIKAYLDDFYSRGIEGLIMHAHAYPSIRKEILSYCQTLPNVVYYDKPVGATEDMHYVDIDIEAGIRKLLKRAVENGRKKIVFFVPYREFKYGKFQSFLLKEKAYTEFMNEHGLPYDRNFNQRYIFPYEPGMKELVPHIQEMIEREKPDAIIARNDAVAAIILNVVLKMGLRCPEDIAITGYDNMKFTEYLSPALTTVDNRIPLVSKSAIEMLVRIIGGEELSKAETQITITPELIVRESL